VLEQVVIEQSAVLHGRDIALELDIPADSTLPVSDAVLHVVLSNLIGNAFMHTASGVVRMVFAHQRLVLSNPATADSEHQAGALDVCALGAPGVRRGDSPGYGLGLDIAQRLCDRAGILLQGRIFEGTFQVTLGGPT